MYVLAVCPTNSVNFKHVSSGGTPRRKIPDSVVEAYLGLLDYFVEKKIEISSEAKESAGTVLMEL